MDTSELISNLTFLVFLVLHSPVVLVNKLTEFNKLIDCQLCQLYCLFNCVILLSPSFFPMCLVTAFRSSLQMPPPLTVLQIISSIFDSISASLLSVDASYLRIGFITRPFHNIHDQPHSMELRPHISLTLLLRSSSEPSFQHDLNLNYLFSSLVLLLFLF